MARSSSSVNTTSRRGGVARHLEGWQGLVVSVFIAGSVAALVVPRPVEPLEVPAPSVDPEAIARVEAADDADADAVERGSADDERSLDADVRELGSALRAYGRADADADEGKLVLERQRVAAVVARAVEASPDDVRRLRAYHLRRFVVAVRAWESGGAEPDDLRELGGGFLRMLRRHGWVDEVRGPRRVLMPDAALRVSFKKRWNEVAGLRGPALALTLDEQRALLGFLIQSPPGPSGWRPEPADQPPGRSKVPRPTIGSTAFEDQISLKKIDELAAVDPTYPAELARGAVLYRLRRYPLAVEAFRRHLEAHPDGPHALRAQNYLRAALGRAADEDI
jgi:hypothetical protein